MSTPDRRSKPRTARESRATGLIQAILSDPAKAADDLEMETRTGGDVTMTLALLEAAESLAQLRGLNLTTQLALVRRRLRGAGFVF